MNGLRRTLSIAALVLAASITGCGTTTALAGHGAATAGGPGQRASVCANLASCHLVARIDVDGDGRPDQVGWRRLSKDAVQIRVQTASGVLVGRRVDVHLWWGGGAWGGAAPVDGKRGAELLVGSEQGAHTPMYSMLTYRDGRLVVEASPSPLSRLWQVDAAYGDYMGWHRHFVDGRAVMTQSIVYRKVDGRSFAGTRVTYRWNADHWVRSGRSAISFPSEKAASSIGGFHVKGLGAFPGLG